MSETVRLGGAYRTLDEQREKLSPAKERFERAPQTIGLFLGPAVFLALYFIPLLFGSQRAVLLGSDARADEYVAEERRQLGGISASVTPRWPSGLRSPSGSVPASSSTS